MDALHAVDPDAVDLRGVRQRVKADVRRKLRRSHRPVGRAKDPVQQFLSSALHAPGHVNVHRPARLQAVRAQRKAKQMVDVGVGDQQGQRLRVLRQEPALLRAGQIHQAGTGVQYHGVSAEPHQHAGGGAAVSGELRPADRDRPPRAEDCNSIVHKKHPSVLAKEHIFYQ